MNIIDQVNLCTLLMKRLEEAVKDRAAIEDVPVLTLDDLRPKGRWVMRGGKLYCSHCGERACVTRDKEDFWYTKGTQFCPNCGADMRGYMSDGQRNQEG